MSKLLSTAVGCTALLSSTFAFAIPIHGVEFPAGVSSFADEVVSYEPLFGGLAPGAAYSDPSEALGPSDYTEGPGRDYVSLGDGGRITLRFTDNFLTGSGNDDLDLWVYEVGVDIEDTFVEISQDGSIWFSVGTIFGSTSGVDIDAFGFGISDFFSYVRLTDDTDEGFQGGNSVGADIEAVGAISSAIVVSVIPAPSTLFLLGAGLIAIARRSWCREEDLNLHEHKPTST